MVSNLELVYHKIDRDTVVSDHWMVQTTLQTDLKRDYCSIARLKQNIYSYRQKLDQIWEWMQRTGKTTYEDIVWGYRPILQQPIYFNYELQKGLRQGASSSR